MTCTMYGRIGNVAENWDIQNATVRSKNGFNVRLRNNSGSFSLIVGSGCVHFCLAFTHAGQEFECSL